jgi:hypothetical protein
VHECICFQDMRILPLSCKQMLNKHFTHECRMPHFSITAQINERITTQFPIVWFMLTISTSYFDGAALVAITSLRLRALQVHISVFVHQIISFSFSFSLYIFATAQIFFCIVFLHAFFSKTFDIIEFVYLTVNGFVSLKVPV